MRRCNNIRLHKDNSSSSDSSSSSSLEDKPKFKLFEEHAFKNVAFHTYEMLKILMESIAIFKIQHPEPPKINEDENFMLSQAKIGKMYKAKQKPRKMSKLGNRFIRQPEHSQESK